MLVHQPYRAARTAGWVLLAAGAVSFLVYAGGELGWWGQNSSLAVGRGITTLNAPQVSAPLPDLKLRSPVSAPISESQKKAALLDTLGNASLAMSAFSRATEQRISDLHLEAAFTPEALVSSARLSESMQSVTRLQELQRQAAQTKSTYYAEVESAIRNSGLSASTVDTQLAVFKTSRSESVKLDAEFQKLENLTTTSAVAILNFAQRQLGKNSVVEGQVVFQGQAQGEEYRRLMGDLVRASTDQTGASVRISALQQKQKDLLERGFRR